MRNGMGSVPVRISLWPFSPMVPWSDDTELNKFTTEAQRCTYIVLLNYIIVKNDEIYYILLVKLSIPFFSLEVAREI